MKVTSRSRAPHIHPLPTATRQRHRGPGSRLTSPIQVHLGGLVRRSRGLQRACRATTSYSPTHYEPLGFMPGQQLADPNRQKGSGGVAVATPAVPPAADCGTATPCGGRLYGGTAVPLTFGLWANSWINPDPRIDLWSMKRNQPTDSGLTFDIRGMQRNAPPVAFFTERTLAAYLAVSDRTIRNWIRRGELPSYKLGAARRIDPADVDAFLAQRRELP